MDNLLYVFLTNLFIILSLICLIVLVTVHVVKKKKFSLVSYFLLFLFIVGIYLFIPSRYTYLGYAFQDPKILEKAIKLSINPYEKRLCYTYMADIYAYDLFNHGIKDGNKAIYYMEKALRGEYKKYSSATTTLAFWYSIKNDYKKTVELNNILDVKLSISLRNVYIMSNQYKKALDTFPSNKNCADMFLKAALYNELGDVKKSIETKKLAIGIYNNQIKNIKEKYKQLEYEEKINKYKTIDSYKNWLKEEAKKYKFD